MENDRFPLLKSHVYWHHKKQFALERDSYSDWTMFAVESGKFSFAIGDYEGIAGSGELVLCPPHTWFYRKTVEPLSFHVLQFEWNGFPDMPPGLWLFADKERLLSSLTYLNKISALADWTAEAVLSGKQHLLNDLWQMIHIERAMKEQPAVVEPEPPIDVDPRIREAQQYLTAHAHEPVNMRKLAGTIGLTPVQLTRGFRAAYFVTPLEYMTALRLDRAARLLEETSFSIDRIAQLCGYENGFYLSRLFTRKRGINPSAYRRSRQV
ncbi:helix-turn-helix domain-containing protein [Paenibacillus sp. GCM10027626]|uniref:helix-turn-helix domain-containing protein n=1 Tax=Paenibacillus sp. GCM10027626 TaxID=3273411 RepID=UPI0036321D93